MHEDQSSSHTIGFQVDRVKHAQPGEAKVRLTLYSKATRQVVQSASCPVTCSTAAVRSHFKHGYHVYGQQQATFTSVPFEHDLVLVARFYLRRRVEHGLADMYDTTVTVDRAGGDAETLAAWAVVPLMLTRNSIMTVNTGTHILQLYEPPVPDIYLIPLEEHWKPRDWLRYGKATLRLHIFQGQPRSGDLTPSDGSEDEEDEGPPNSWLPHRRDKVATTAFHSTDGFDLYIDGCRNLPDAVTITRVASRVMDRKYERVGKDINTSVKLDSDIYNPVYEHRVEFREPNMPPSSTLALKVYTIDKFNRQLVVVGYATLNIFVETGTDKQPATDTGGVQISLNVGCHQLRLYHTGPNGIDPLTCTLLRDLSSRYVPCATLLVRIIPAPIGPNGRCLQAQKVPQSDWARLGLWQLRPSYESRVYFSSSCTPTRGENRLFHTLMSRPRVSIREIVHTELSGPRDRRELSMDSDMLSYIRNKLTKLMDVEPIPLDLTFIAEYSPKHGIKFAMDGALNLPWANFTHAHFCLNPPAAFYMGQPHASYDKLTFTENLDLHSTNKAPEWRDGFSHFPNRSYHRYLTMIIHLQEISIAVERESYKYGLLEQAWTAVQVFTSGYANTVALQLPLFSGSPSLDMLQQLAHQPCKEHLSQCVSSGSIKLLDSASVFVRLCDGRRDTELVPEIAMEEGSGLDRSYLPPDHNYAGKIDGQELQTLVPQGKVPAQFVPNLAQKFKSLVYKLYEDGKTAMK